MQQLTPHVRVNTSRLWETNTGIIQGPQGALLVDPGVFDAEFRAIAEASGEVAAGFVTHAHWDHVLWHRSLGEDVPRYATPETIALIQKDRDRILRNLTATEAEIHAAGYSAGEELWDRTQLFKEQPIQWGPGEIAGISVEVIHIPGHEDGQAALLLPDHRVAFVADTLSDIETPSIHTGNRNIALYLNTLDRLQRVIERVDWVVPGHGKPTDRVEAQRRLDADRRYLSALAPAVHSAPEGEEGAEDVAKRILHELDENRAASDLAWAMHLENVHLLLAEREALTPDLPVRRGSRLIVLDNEGRVWMLRINDPVRPRWILPGGGLEEGETWEDAARRELWEECAINDAEIGPMVATRESFASAGPTWIKTEERYFVVRMAEQLPGAGNMHDHEIADYTRQGWLSADDIRASNEVVYPLGLADLLDQIACGEYPSVPIRFAD